MATSKFHAGERVIVRSEREILATLDQNGTLDGLPFTAEMWQYCGRAFTVRTRINRLHIDGTGVRRIKNALILSEVRCDGKAHNGCQRACYLLFKDAWLDTAPPNGGGTDQVRVSPEVALSVRGGPSPCQGQGSVLAAATCPLAWWDPRPYVDDLICGTYSIYDVATILLFRLNRKWRACDQVWSCASGRKTLGTLTRMALCVLRQNLEWLLRLSRSSNSPSTEANENQTTFKPQTPEPMPVLSPGDIVEVRSREEILATLDTKEKHRGLGFCGSMLKFCGQRYRIRAPVSRLIDERTDKEVPRIINTYMLEGVFCDGISYRGCPRACYWMWRAAWLRKVDPLNCEATVTCVTSRVAPPDPAGPPRTCEGTASCK